MNRGVNLFNWRVGVVVVAYSGKEKTLSECRLVNVVEADGEEAARPTFAGRGTRDGMESRHEGDHNMILHRRHFLLTPSLYHRASGRYVSKHPAQIMARATNVTVNTTLTRERPQWDPQGRQVNTNDEMYLICLALPVHVFSHILE